MFLGKNFTLFLLNDKKKTKILHILDEMEKISSQLFIFTGKMNESFKFFLKRFVEFIQQKENLRNLRDLKSFIHILEEIYMNST